MPCSSWCGEVEQLGKEVDQAEAKSWKFFH